MMVPCETILETARKESVDIIGLSGLITPSLDEMVHVGREMQRTGFDLPLLIGGATTSAKHTAVKIAPAYSADVIHVLDASRSVGVVEKLINPEARPQLDAENRELQKQLVASHEKRQEVKLVPYAEALARRFKPIGRRSTFRSRRSSARACWKMCRSRTLREYIDWSPFFLTWELKGKYPRIFDDPQLGEAARKLFDDANELLDRIIDEKLLTARGVYGFWPAASEGDDIIVYADESRSEELCRFHALRQQWERKGQDAFLFAGRLHRPGRQRPQGLHRRVRRDGRHRLRRAGRAVRPRARRLQLDHDQGAGRPAGRGVCRVPARRSPPRLGLSAATSSLSNDELIDRKVPRHPPGARLPGPARPHREAHALRTARRRAQRPASGSPKASPCTRPPASRGLYFAHPEARYFAVDRITRDQVEDYARRKGMTRRRSRTLAGAEFGLRTLLTLQSLEAVC